MKRKRIAVGASVCLAALVAAALGQSSDAVKQLNKQLNLPPSSRVDVRNRFDVQERGHDSGRAVSELLRKWKAAGSESDRAKVEKELRAVLKSQFEARLGAHQKEIEQLEAKVKQLREQLELRRKKQDEIVDFRLQQLLREAQGLGWGTEPVTRQGFPQIGTKWSSNASDPFASRAAAPVAPPLLGR